MHDPPGALLADAARWLPRLARLYDGIAVASSPPTSARLRALLAQRGVDAGCPASNTRGPLYRLALRSALAGGAAQVHYLDFDRALHWVATRPAELEGMLARARRHAGLIVGRTPRAHASHHRALVDTETAATARFASSLGLRGRVDFLVPSFVLPRVAVLRLLARSRARNATMYGEWIALLLGLGVPLAYVECEGLDWETPDRHRDEIRRVGRGAWQRAFSTPAEWAMRQAMAADFQRGLARARERWPLAGVAVRRLSPLRRRRGRRR